MNKKVALLLAMAVTCYGLVVAIPQAQSDEWQCLQAYSRFVSSMERGVEAKQRGDYCSAADSIETALNYGGVAQSVCTGYRRDKVSSEMAILAGVLADLVRKCGY